MTRDAFLRTLRQGLAGLPPREIEDIVGDYAAHFADASGRGEAEVAAALGDPTRIARELRAEAGLRRFEAHWSVSNMLAATIALAGLAFVDIVFLLPLLITAVVLALGLASRSSPSACSASRSFSARCCSNRALPSRSRWVVTSSAQGW